MDKNVKRRLLGMTPDQLQEVAREAGLKPFAAEQMADWLYRKRVDAVDRMTNLSLEARERLKRLGYEVGLVEPCDVRESRDGTRKYLFPTLGGGFIEAVCIPDVSPGGKERVTLCVSSQAGCKMGCAFCMTGRQGFRHQLTAGEILGQALVIPESERLTNMVFMGMGEPTDNLDEVLRSLEILTSDRGLGWSPARITVSTIGVIPAMKKLLDRTKVHLAVSLHNPFGTERAQIMPIEQVYPAREIIRALREYDFAHQRRLSFEYIMFDGVNDTPRHVDGLVELLRGLDCRINLIRFHAIPDCPLKGSGGEKIRVFNGALNKAGITTTTRLSRGEDILAACGLLSTSAFSTSTLKK